MFDYECGCGKSFERFLPIPEYSQPQVCECGSIAQKVILQAPAAFVGMDIHYESPIDGRPITSKHARDEDLARSDCVPYEPTLRAHSEKRAAQEDAALEKSMDRTVEAEIHRMPARKREKLAAELEGGMTAEVARVTPSQQSFRS